jgi:hypothetical protein
MAFHLNSVDIYGTCQTVNLNLQPILKAVLLITFQNAATKDSSGCSAMVCINLNVY